jgi:hypothetical protein
LLQNAFLQDSSVTNRPSKRAWKAISGLGAKRAGGQSQIFAISLKVSFCRILNDLRLTRWPSVMESLSAGRFGVLY